ncbi:MAG: hypothetical protein B6I37_08435 [Desulfobacteraceae bacterium 4572_35.2]|nr:MAG: hypothetical protein B6I37_08435 [Desulfobacteraceae bacterium 4572_35.2]
MSVEVYTDSNEKILRDLCDDLMQLVGKEFFAALVTKLARVAEADYAFIGQFTSETCEVVRTVAVYADGKTIDNIEFGIENTPCEVVVKNGYQRYPHSVLELFPLDHLAIQLDVNSYVGVPLIDSSGTVLGPLAVFSRKPLHNLSLIETALHMFALRASAELERLTLENKRQDELHFLQSLLDAVPNPVFYKDNDGRNLGCNKSYEDIVGLSRQEMHGHTVNEILSGQRSVIGLREDQNLFATQQPRTYENQFTCPDGNTLDFLFNKAPIFNRDGEMMGLVGTIQDITSLKQIETAMQTLVESTIGHTGSECYNRVAEQLCQWFEADCVIVGRLYGDGKITSLATLRDGDFLSEYNFDIAKTPCEKVINDGMCLVSEGLINHFPDSFIVRDLEAEGYVGTPLRSHDGTIIGVLSVLSRSPIKSMSRAKDVLAIMAVRVSAEIEREKSEHQLRENESHLEYLAYHDVLTELPNRQLFRDRLQHAISMARMAKSQVAVLFLDLDRFKKINDSLGHEFGDQLLCEVAKRLQKCARDVDTVARISGDEFGIVLDQISSVENVILVAEEIHRTIVSIPRESMNVPTSY